MNKYILIFLLLAGCSTTTYITKNGEEVWTVKGKSDALIEVKDGDKSVMVDNRGRPSFLETLLGGAISNRTVEVK